MQEIDYDSLIQKAHNAFQNGNKSSAYDYAQAAVEKMPDSEQAWLILASLSEGEQSLRYLESALRANPESQAARKAIRLVVNQMASKKRKREPKESVSSLSDTTPIHIAESACTLAKEVSVEEEIEIFKEAAEDGSTIKKTIIQAIEKNKEDHSPESKTQKQEETAAEDITSNPTKKEILLKKLQIKTTAPSKPTQTENNILKIIKEDKLADAPQTLSTPLPAPISESQAEGQEKELLENKINKEQESAVENFEKKTSKSAKQKARKKEKIKTAKISRDKKTVRKTEDEIKKAFSKDVKKMKDKEKREVDVDIIELVLISLAAILLPLIAFFYFFLTNK